MSTYDIAKIVGRDPKRIYEKLKTFGIPTRPRGLNLKGADNYSISGGKSFLGRKHSTDTRQLLSERASRPRPWLAGENNGMSGKFGAANPRYKDGSSPLRQSLYSQWKVKAFLKSILKRDENRCVRCSAIKAGAKSLHVHHIKAWAGNPSLRFDPANCVTLCKCCHDWVHSSANVTREYLG